MAVEKKYNPPPTPPTTSVLEHSRDIVYPVHYFDNDPRWTPFILRWSFRFDAKLDPEKLRLSLWKLLETGDWRKLGGRLCKDATGTFSIHVPVPFSPARPPFSYAHSAHHVPFAQHPLSKLVPVATPHASIQRSSSALDQLVFGPDPSTNESIFAVTVDDLCRAPDRPQLALSVVTFDDATLVGFSAPHLSTDALGFRALVEEWVAVMAGREPRPLLSAWDDPLGRVGTDDDADRQDRDLASGRALAGVRLACFYGLALAEAFLLPRVVNKTIYLPAAALKRYVAATRAALPDEEGAPGRKPFVSEGDVLWAWLTHVSVRARVMPRPVICAGAANLRPRLPGTFVDGGAYVSNVIQPLLVPLGIAEVRAASVPRLALTIRRALTAQLGEGQLRGLVWRTRQEREATGRGLFVGSPAAWLMSVINWAKGAFFDVSDFGAARVGSDGATEAAEAAEAAEADASKAAEAAEAGASKATAAGPATGADDGRCLPSYFNVSWPFTPAVQRVSVIILGKDQQGGVWLSATLSQSAWKVVEKDLKTNWSTS